MDIKKINSQLKTEYSSIENLYDYQWDEISKNINLSEDIVAEFSDKINWKSIRCFHNFQYEFIEKNLIKFDLNTLAKDYVLDENLILLGWNNFFTLDLINNQLLTNKIIDLLLKENPSEFTLTRIILTQNLNDYYLEKIINKFVDNKEQVSNVIWESISQCAISEEFISKYKDNLNWESLTRYNLLSEEFLKNNLKRLDWWNISFYQKLTEDFIIENRANLEWEGICQHQKITPKIIDLCIENINQEISNWHHLLRFNIIPEIALLKVFEITGWHRDVLIPATKYQILSENLIDKLLIDLNKYDRNWIFFNQKFSKEYIHNHQENFDFYLFSDNKFLSDELVIAYKKQISDGLAKYAGRTITNDEAKLENYFWEKITANHNISKVFLKEHNAKANSKNWFYKSANSIKKMILESHFYETNEDSFYAYVVPKISDNLKINDSIYFNFNKSSMWGENFYVKPFVGSSHFSSASTNTLFKVEVNYEDVREFTEISCLPVTQIKIVGIIERDEFNLLWNKLVPKRNHLSVGTGRW